MVSHDTPLESFVQSLNGKDSALRALITPKLGKLQRELFFLTVGDLWGSLHPQIPASPQDEGRCLAGSFLRMPESQSLERRTANLASSIGLSLETTKNLVNALEAVPRPLNKIKPTDSEWYLGAKKRNRLRSGREYHVVEAEEIFPAVSTRREPWILTGLNERIGLAWDQGQRGTCVSQAAAGLFGYISSRSGKRLSRQFLFHQCKMIDGNPYQDGTSLASAFRVFSDNRLSGSTRGFGTADVGIPTESSWPYDTRVIAKNPAHAPPPSSVMKHLYAGSRWANTSGEVIRCALDSGRLVDDVRAILYHERKPVVVALVLYESFNNLNSRRTGWITIPILPGDREIGGHAMLVVGFDDTIGTFLVRNSWGTGWAPENRYGYPGHAVIPYKYFIRFGRGGYGVRLSNKIDVSVEPAARLYNRCRHLRAGKVRTLSMARHAIKKGEEISSQKKSRSLFKRIFGFR